LPVRVDGKFKLGKKLGRGAHGKIYELAMLLWLSLLMEWEGDVYVAKDLFSGIEMAAKLRPFDLGKQSQMRRPLQHEFSVYKDIASGIGIPRIHWFGTDVGCQVMILNHLGPSLEDMMSRGAFEPFSVGTTASVACQVVRITYPLPEKTLG
jgi:hypothetical protein